MSVADSITSFKQFEGDTDLRVSLRPVRGVQEQTDRQTDDDDDDDDDDGGGGGGCDDADDVNDVHLCYFKSVLSKCQDFSIAQQTKRLAAPANSFEIELLT